MAWTCSSSTNSGLVNNLVRNHIIKSARVEQALRGVDRGHYVPPRLRGLAYEDSPQMIGYNVTISAPHMHATCLEVLADKLIPGATALDIGSGSGYLTAAMSLMVSPGGKVWGVEHIPQLVERSKECILADNQGLIDSDSLEILEGDGRSGLPDHAPYDAIHVGAAMKNPKPLIAQLKVGGVLVAPVGLPGRHQELIKFTRTRETPMEFFKEDMLGVVYVPLTDREAQLE